jgi:lipoprotein-anchoring transpeptidase ErfK/SrfK
MKIIITEEQYKKITSEQIIDRIINFFTGDDDKTTEQTGCSVDNLKPSNWQDLYSKLVKNKMITQGEALIIVWGSSQKLYYTKDGKSVITSFKVSTGANGFGNTVDNKKTPTGLMKVTNTIRGKDYEVMVGKKGTGKILAANKESQRIDDKTGKPHIAEVLSGILELSGLEKCNSNVFKRNIYFHGTNREQFLGTARSNGCIRVSTPSIKWLISHINVGTKVYIQP